MKNRSGIINKNFFLHIHANRIQPYALNPGYSYGLGVILVFFFLIMVITGIILLMNYTPSVDRAYESVKDIIYVVPGGRLVRNIHRLTSNLMVFTLFLHLLRVFYTASYQGGRKRNWRIGIFLFFLVLLMSFSGYLLPWDQLSYWAVTIGSNVAASFRELTDLLGITSHIDPGAFIQRLLVGSDSVSALTLKRFFMLHVFLLPLTMIVLLSVHLWRIRKDGGLSIPVSKRTSSSEKVYAWPVLMWIELAIFLSILALVLVLSNFIEAPLIEKANPAHPENPAKAPWYFLGIQELLSYSAFTGGLLVPGLFLYFLFSLPDRDQDDKKKGYWFAGNKGRIIAFKSLLISFLTVVIPFLIQLRFGWLRSWWPDIPQWLIMLLNPASISLLVFVAWSRIIQIKTESTRLSAIALFTTSMFALVLYTIIGIWFRGENWDFIFLTT